MITAVIFDIDGTLIDSVDLHARSWHETFQHFGFEFPYDVVRSQIGKGGDQLLPALLPADVVESQGKAIEKYRSDLFKKNYLPEVRPFPDVRPLIERLRADGKKIALGSSASADDLAAYKKIADIDDLIDEETSSDDAAKSKPHPDIFQAALDRLGNPDPAAVLVVGDTPYDAQAATKAGLRTLGVLCGGFPESDLRAAGCIALYAGPSDLLARYDASPLAQPSPSPAATTPP